jgi:hypothetical protein
MLRAYQKVREGQRNEEYREDLAFLQAKDIDLSVRLGALLAFDALLVGAAINPISASPGAPLSLDAPTQPWEVVTISIAIILLAISGIICVRAIMLGEEFSADGIEDNSDAIVQRMFATYCTSVDFQARMVTLAARFSIAGGALTVIGCTWIMLAKIL